MSPRIKLLGVSVIALALGGWGRVSAEPPVVGNCAEDALRKSCEYLWSQQAADGGWHSGQYAVLRSGQSLTPFVLHTLLQVPDAAYARPAGGVTRAFDFIRQHVDEHGALGHADPDVVEYPVYSTAYALRCLLEAHGSFEIEADVPVNGVLKHIRTWDQKDGILVNQMRTYLTKAQFSDANGFSPDSPAYGGWGLDAPRHPGEPGHMDLAHTRRALESLASIYKHWPTAVRVEDEFQRPVTDRARRFLLVVQKHPDASASQPNRTATVGLAVKAPYDGGFYFSPVVPAANKGRTEEPDGAAYFRSYATATCDGILALLAAGVDRNDERVVHAANWLRAHDDVNYPQGVPTDHPEPWGDAIHFYHFAVRAEAYAALDWPGDWRSNLAAAVAKDQAADGSFRNTISPLMKEDDPLLCTALAAVALSHCLDAVAATSIEK